MVLVIKIIQCQHTSVYENRTENSCRFDKVNNNDPIVCKTNV
jgi:hypothetical protein